MDRANPNPNALNSLQAQPASPERDGATQPKRKRGRPTIDYPSAISPTIKDIIFAASFYEGEGTINNRNQITIDIAQNDREKLDWLQVRFGGKVYGPYMNKLSGNNYYHWILTRERALGFMFTIFTFLSKSRREQFRTGKRIHQQSITSEAFISKAIKRMRSQRAKGPMKLFGVRK